LAIALSRSKASAVPIAKGRDFRGFDAPERSKSAEERSDVQIGTVQDCRLIRHAIADSPQKAGSIPNSRID
jgi:hypothetical protein